MRVHIATDHAGLELSDYLVKHLTAKGYEMINHGPKSYDPEDDYPAFCINAAKAVVADQRAGVDALGIVLGGSGNGEQIAANKVEGIRAALAWNMDTAKLAREHNNANVISFGAAYMKEEDVLRRVDIFLSEVFSSEEKHHRRVDEISALEDLELC